MSTLVQAQPPADSLRLCSNALDNCSDVVKQQDNEIGLLKVEVKGLEDKLSSDTAPTVPWYVWLVGGALAGAAGAVVLHR